MQRPSLAAPAKAWALLCAVLGVSLTANTLLTGVLAALAFSCLAFEHRWRALAAFGGFYMLLALLLYLIRFHGLRMIVFSEFYVLVFYALMPAFLAAWSLVATPPGNLSAALSRIHAPTSAILGLLVVFRFFPTMKAEWREIRQSMRNRRLTGPAQVLRHPAATCEYVLVPLLLRCLQIADQLSVSAEARGAQAPGVRGSYYARGMEAPDFICLGAWTVATALFLAIGGVR